MSAHIPVMLEEVIGAVQPRDEGIYVDGTFGAGGYSRAMLKAAHCRVYAIDRDPDTRAFAEELEREFPGRFAWLLGNFSDMCALLSMHGITGADGVVLDIGVSSMQMDRADRGFSIQRPGPLDMRMSGSGITAADLVNTADERELADIIYTYGEEHAARRIARSIVQARALAPIETTAQLAEIVARAAGGGGKTHPATRTFQALRIHINQELEQLEAGLQAASALLNPHGRLVVVTFHSLEDRIVKRFFTSRCERSEGGNRHLPVVDAVRHPPLFARRPGKITVSAQEAKTNPRSRSATLRFAERSAS